MKKIMLVGGGTLGPTTPLLAVFDAAKKTNKDWQFVWVGTNNGPEQKLVENLMPFRSIVTAKLDRFFSLRNIFAPILLSVAFLQSVWLLLKIKPDVVVSAGGFNAVPVGYASFCLRTPIVIHEQDVLIGLANRLLRPIATRRTSVFGAPGSEKIGNLIRINEGNRKYNYPDIFDVNKPFVLITGGGTGAKSLNQLVVLALPELTKITNILHLTGKGKSVKVLPTPGYEQKEFLDADMLPALAAAEISISRAGMGTLSELALLSKPAIVVPIPRTHQTHNSDLLVKNSAAIVLDQTGLTPKRLVEAVKGLLEDSAKQKQMGENLHKLIPGGTEKFLTIIDDILERKVT